ncbi:MAG TPA: ferrochelatase, partial [Chlamydiales bacterium]|nr:ferrochelatase [Chlamydiales bacterium]
MKKAILLLNVGTPLSPQVADVKRYLTEFLLDPRVITKQALLRQLLVRGIIVPFRKRKSAKLYQAIWTEKGSPLLTHTIDLKNSLQELLRSEYIVEAAMRYQEPTIDQALHRLQKERLSHLIVVPLFPQYASATTGSSIEAVMQKMARWDHFPQKIVFLNQFWNDQHFIDAFVESAKKWPIQNYDKILFSFHGLPQEQDRASATH